ncbi:hypothetical protein VOLCADRAFT_96251 [Volvox carteri f. nagariensis]|uniref:Uncharacterized protein n=1 Tax=Volvox carteri f. nagariensis TaxID=3068 RepID=D8U9M0_VOLCA|nr:uncharacterized protein VOLCADRAFT_96251 [Volvox carteri f. nagariensis]EFJ43666.1 hypothetical protein VOLCADRAFT_96251 [Volvox carteri f. nagariensis]|eukprot:XP_002955366.1 hypothetical protein VOLCADRAFT_96251 [Volvox carteri f. nagariensis]
MGCDRAQGTRLLLLLWVAANGWHISCSAAKDDPKAQELMDAINTGYQPALTSWNDAILNDTLSNLKLARILWSSKEPRFQFTVFTQLTINRLPTLFNMCTTFTGPLSAAVFVALVQQPDVPSHRQRLNTGGPAGGGDEQAAAATSRVVVDQLSAPNAAALQEAVQLVQSFHDRVDSRPDMCQLDLMLFYELYDSDQSKLLYPVNYLRNYARMQVRTRLLAMIDVDMYVSRTLSEEMAREGRIAHYESLCAERRATVLPAFEPTRPGDKGRGMALKITQVTKSELASMHGRNKEAIQFKLRVFPRGHTPTDYVRWFTESQPYPVSYKRFYEPWFITCDEVMPWYDVDFRGYGMNKIVLIASLNYYNYTFWIHPNAWLVHNPHGDTEVRKLVAREASDVNKFKAKLPPNALYRKLTLLFGKAKRGMMRGTYDPRVDPRMMAVYGKVSWLRPPPQLKGIPTPESVFI